MNKTKKVVLFCIPHAGGNSSIFNKWSGYMPDNIIFKPIELSGRGKRLNEKLDTSFEGMVGDVFNSIKKIMVNFDMDYYIFGHSMGAWIVLELLYYFNHKVHKGQINNRTKSSLSGTYCRSCN
ncbi:thioesterase II family protein, partial [Streptococcus mutans]|uniref:thioesterase II family protein n=1 Tax=Streptococcus mutans TaxID=1309 RepID=UPI00232F1F31